MEYEKIVQMIYKTGIVTDIENKHGCQERKGWGGIKLTAAAKSLQSCPTLCDPMDCSPPGSSAHGISQARVLEWGATAFSITIYI